MEMYRLQQIRPAWTDEASSESSSVSEIATDGVKLCQLRECHTDSVERLLRRRIRSGTSGVGVNLEKDSIDPCADCSPRQQRRQRTIASSGVSRRSWPLSAVGRIKADGDPHGRHVGEASEVDHEVIVPKA